MKLELRASSSFCPLSLLYTDCMHKYACGRPGFHCYRLVRVCYLCCR